MMDDNDLEDNLNERVSSPDIGYESSSPSEFCDYYNQPFSVEGAPSVVDEEIGDGTERKRGKGRPRQDSVIDLDGAKRSRQKRADDKKKKFHRKSCLNETESSLIDNKTELVQLKQLLKDAQKAYCVFAKSKNPNHIESFTPPPSPEKS